jgi:hypothetical protein
MGRGYLISSFDGSHTGDNLDVEILDLDELDVTSDDSFGAEQPCKRRLHTLRHGEGKASESHLPVAQPSLDSPQITSQIGLMKKPLYFTLNQAFLEMVFTVKILMVLPFPHYPPTKPPV